jgi:VCBS repeat-containing protein
VLKIIEDKGREKDLSEGRRGVGREEKGSRNAGLLSLLAVPVLLALLLPAAYAIAGGGKSVAKTSSATCLDLPVTLMGTPGDDRLRGTPGTDVIDGLAGNDRIIGGGGNDVVCGGPGDDLITTGKGPDKISGGPGDDHLVARRGPDFLYGGPNDDILNGGLGVDGCDGGSGTDTERHCENDAPPITENGKNQPPGAVGDTATTDSSTVKVIDVLANDTDVDGDALTVASVDTTSTKGKVTIGAGGANVSYDPNGQFGSLAPGQQANDSFTYTISDGHGHTSTAGVLVTVTGIDDPPVAVKDAKTLTEDDPATAIDVLANDTDIDGGPKSIASVTQPANGAVVITGGGTGLTYQPAANFCGTDTFTYALNGGSTATVTATVACVDDPPVAVNDSKTLNEDAGATAVDVLANDTDVDGGPKSIASVTQPANGTVVITGGGTGLTYAPNANYCNNPPGTTPDTFTYALNGGSTATVSVTVICVDDPPTAVNDSKTVVEDSGATAVDVLANDTDTDGGPKSVASVTQPANGAVVITGGGTGLTYAPGANYCNSPPGTTPDTFTYTLNGGSTATVSATVTCVDDSPVAVNDSKTLNEDAGATAVDVLANDTDVDGGPKSISSVTQPANGTVVITGGGTGVTYQPNANYCNNPPGTSLDTFTYTLNGGSVGTVSAKVECVDDPPTAVNDSKTLNEDSGATAIDVFANDTDIDGGPKSVASVTQPANGSVVITGGGTGLTYAPSANYCNSPPGTTPDTFTYTLNGGSTATVSVTVTCVDDPPVAVNDSKTITEDDPATAINVLANDTDVDGGPKSISSVTQPANGAVVITGGGTGLTYQPNANYCNEPPGTTPDTFEYTITGGSKATVSVKVTCVNDPPTNISISKSSIAENQSTGTTVGVFSTTDVDLGDSFTYTLVGGIGAEDNGSFTISGNELKTAESFNFEARASYSIRVKTTDSGSAGFEKQLTITVENVNDPPTNISLSKSDINENEPAATKVGSFSTTDEDVGDSFTYTLVSGAGAEDNGSFEISGNELKAKSSFNFEAKASYKIRVRTKDSGNATFEKEFTIAVNDVNDPPKTVADSYTGAVGNTDGTLGNVDAAPSVALGGMSGNVPSANDSDEDAGDSISVVPETVPTTGGGSVTIDADGTFTYSPGVGDKNQSDSFTYKVTDGEATTPGTVTVGIENTLVWYVNSAAGSEGDGRSATPYKTLSGINGAGGVGDADGSNDYIFLYGSGSYGGGLPLEASQILDGSPQGLSVPNHENLISPSGGSNPSITNAGGDAIALANGSEVQRVDAANAAGVGIKGVGVTTATVGAGTKVSGNSGGGVALSGAAGGAISIGSTIENETGSVVSVSNRNSGTVTLSGPVTSSNGGVIASSNTGAHVSYTGALHLTRSGGGETFSATGGGGIKATNSDNQLSSGSGTAVKVTGTTIDSGGVNFKSVSSSGASNGIVLENTGETASLTVTGTGSAGSGGTIQSSSGPGILLNNTSAVSLASVKVSGGGDDGIRGAGVKGLSLTGSSEITNNGNAVTEDGLDFTNLTGTVNLTKATVSGSADRNVAVVNESGTVNATFKEGSYSNTNNSAVGGDSIFFEGTNTGTIGVNVEKATFTNNKGDHVQVTTDAANTVAENVTIKENTMSNTVGQPGGAVTLNPGGNATMEAAVQNNNIQGARIEAITVDTPGSIGSPQPAQVNARIEGNTIGAPGTANSGSSSGNDIGVTSNGSATIKAVVANNNLYRYINQAGIELGQGDGVGTLDATVHGNTIANPDTTFGTFGIFVEIGSEEGDTGTSCLDIGGAGGLANVLTGSATAGNADIRFPMRGEATAQLAGYSGSAHDTAAVQTYLAGRNTAPEGVKATQFDATSNYAQVASCPTPP